MPLNANAARSTFACRRRRWFLRLLLLLLLLPFVAPQLHATPTENGSERERRSGHYIQAFLCAISWHFSVRSRDGHGPGRASCPAGLFKKSPGFVHENRKRAFFLAGPGLSKKPEAR
ncbi:hypothetical protein ACLKA7_004571 [Drosophila subpalustris]